jgi:hypothetical protein
MKDMGIKDKLIIITVTIGLAAAMTPIATRLIRKSTETWAVEFPAKGLVMPDDGNLLFEALPTMDVKMLSKLGFPAAMNQLNARVRHLVIHLDCHYFFTTDGRVLVMTLSNGGRAPRLVETKQWSGPPHGYTDYHKELLPGS